MDIRVEGNRLVAPGTIPFTRDPVEVRTVNEGVSDQQIIDAIQKNGRDELLVRGDDGERYVLSAATLAVNWRVGFPSEGERVSIGDIEGTIIHADNERNVAHIVGQAATGATLALAPVAGIAYAHHKIAAAPGLLSLAVGFLRAPINMGIGATAAAIPGLGTAGAAALLGYAASDRSGAALDELTTRVDK